MAGGVTLRLEVAYETVENRVTGVESKSGNHHSLSRDSGTTATGFSTTWSGGRLGNEPIGHRRGEGLLELDLTVVRGHIRGPIRARGVRISSSRHAARSF